MVLNTLESLKDITPGSSEVVSFYRTPGLENPTPNTTQLFNIFFVFKKEGNSVLLAKTSDIIDLQTPDKDIWGWVPTNRILSWDTRNAIEPDFREAAARERKNAGVKALVFDDELSAKNFAETKGIDSTTLIWADDPYEKRNIGDWRRFPLFDIRNGIMKIGCMGKIKSLDGLQMSQTDFAESMKKYQDLRAKIRSINMVFVIDGTESMGKYFQPVANGIAESAELLGPKNTVKFGAIVYRDLAEGPEFLTEKFKLTPVYKDFNAWLLKVFSDQKNKHDTDDPEAVFYGLNEALTSLLPKDETNLVILVGDAGNHQRQDASQVSKDALIKLMVEKNVHFISFQVNHSGKTAYDNFLTQSKSLIQETAEEIFKSTEKVRKELGYANKKPEFENRGNNELRLNNSALIGRVIYCDPNKSQKTERLQKEIADAVEYISNTWTEMVLAKTNKVMEDGRSSKAVIDVKKDADKYVNDFQPSIALVIKRLKLSPDKLEIIAKERSQILTLGYCPQERVGLKYPLYQNVLFLTRFELGQLLQDLGKIQSEGKSNEARRAMAKAWLELLKEHMGDQKTIDPDVVSLQDITTKVFGLPSRSSFLQNKKLNDITDPVAFPDLEFEQLAFDLKRKFDKLMSIFDSPYAYSFMSNDKTYYWIEHALLP